MTDEELQKLEQHISKALTDLNNCRTRLIRQADTNGLYFPNEVEITDHKRYGICSELMYARSIIYMEQSKRKDKNEGV